MWSFSRRHGYAGRAKEITIREDAPKNLRYVVLETARELGWGPSWLRPIVCRVLRTPPDLNNWSEYPNIDQEVGLLVNDCSWFKVYDIIEAIYSAMAKHDQKSYRSEDADKFEKAINGFFVEEGIGWQLVDGKIVAGGDEGFQEAVKTAASELQDISAQQPPAIFNLR